MVINTMLVEEKIIEVLDLDECHVLLENFKSEIFCHYNVPEDFSTRILVNVLKKIGFENQVNRLDATLDMCHLEYSEDGDFYKKIVKHAVYLFQLFIIWDRQEELCEIEIPTQSLIDDLPELPLVKFKEDGNAECQIELMVQVREFMRSMVIKDWV